MKFLLQLFGWFCRRLCVFIVKLNRDVEFITIDGSTPESIREDYLIKIFDFRNQCYRGKLDYLIPKRLDEINFETAFDRRCVHLIAVKKGQPHHLLGVVRLCAQQFELEKLLYQQRPTVIMPTSKCLEISRLVVKKEGRGLGSQLLILAGAYALDHGHDHFVGICTEQKFVKFQKFNPDSLDLIKIKGREGQDYHLLFVRLPHIASLSLKHYFKNKVKTMQMAIQKENTI